MSTEFSKSVVSLCVLMWSWIATCAPEQSGFKEYCQFESFNATCGPREVILMNHAEYGRMRLGRCIQTDVNIPCSSNILPQMHTRCSGRASCLVQLPDSELHSRVHCAGARDLAYYLEAEFTCLHANGKEQRVDTSDNSDSSSPSPTEQGEAACVTSGGTSSPTPTQVGPSGIHLASALLLPGGLASPRCPWSLQVLPGQTIYISVLYFNSAGHYNTQDWNGREAYTDDSAALYCPVMMQIKEPEQEVAQQVCIGSQDNGQEGNNYNSRGSSLQLTLSPDDISEDIVFILKAEVRGCANPALPPGGWLKRSSESATATVGCNNTKHLWHLVCKDTTWVGSVGNCTGDMQKKNTPTKQRITAPYGLLIAVLIGIIIGVVCGFLMLACVLWCKKRGTRRQRHPYATAGGANYGEVLVPDQECKVHQVGEYGYTHVWEVQKQRQPSLAGSLSRGGRDAMEMCQTCTIRHSAGATPTVIFHKKDHVYESPQFAESVADSGITSEGSSVPFYHEFDLTGPGQSAGPVPTVPSSDVKGDATEGTSDDTDEDLEDKISALIKPPGYNLVPKSPEGERHENQYS